ncbi:hypothetical protein AVEN_202447-1, partial [Araneus ventricosus]
QIGKSYAAAARSNLSNVNKPMNPMTSKNINKESPPTHNEQPTSRSHQTIHKDPLPIGEGFNDVMALVAEVQKIFSGINNISETLRRIQATDNVWEKLMILTEALRPNTISP